MNEYTIEISKEDTNRFEKLHLQVDAREYVIHHLLFKKDSVDPVKFAQYHNEFLYFYSQLNKLKRELQEKYLKDFSVIRFWEIEFGLSVMRVVGVKNA